MQMERTERVTLTNMCMIYDNSGNVLVEEKVGKDYKGLIFPGGHIEKEEPIVDSVIREIYEETGLTISNLELCGVKDWITDEGTRYIVFLYKTGTYSGNVRSSSEGRVFWMSLDELKSKEPFWHMDKMLDLFCGSCYSELFLEDEHDNRLPILK
jgi:8-oxo-dGTP diphosphatase